MSILQMLSSTMTENIQCSQNQAAQMVKTVRGTNEIELSGLVEGVYLLRITDADGKRHLARVVVE